MVIDPDHGRDRADALAALGASWTELRVAADSLPWRAWTEAVGRWRAAGRVGAWWFVRKPPGLRVRLQVRRDEPAVVDEAGALLAPRPWRRDVYEPESFRFGGAEGLAVAHDWFGLDADLAARWEAGGRPGGDPRLLSLVVLADLQVAVCGDRAELWDVWQRLGEAVGTQPGLDPATVEAALSFDPSFVGGLPAAARELLEAWHEGVEPTAAALDAAAVGRRAWLVAVAPFHWNRLGLDLDDVRTMTGAMLACLDR